MIHRLKAAKPRAGPSYIPTEKIINKKAKQPYCQPDNANSLRLHTIYQILHAVFIIQDQPPPPSATLSSTTSTLNVTPCSNPTPSATTTHTSSNDGSNATAPVSMGVPSAPWEPTSYNIAFLHYVFVDRGRREQSPSTYLCLPAICERHVNYRSPHPAPPQSPLRNSRPMTALTPQSFTITMGTVSKLRTLGGTFSRWTSSQNQSSRSLATPQSRQNMGMPQAARKLEALKMKAGVDKLESGTTIIFDYHNFTQACSPPPAVTPTRKQAPDQILSVVTMAPRLENFYDQKRRRQARFKAHCLQQEALTKLVNSLLPKGVRPNQWFATEGRVSVPQAPALHLQSTLDCKKQSRVGASYLSPSTSGSQSNMPPPPHWQSLQSQAESRGLADCWDPSKSLIGPRFCYTDAQGRHCSRRPCWKVRPCRSSGHSVDHDNNAARNIAAIYFTRVFSGGQHRGTLFKRPQLPLT
ncbi:hypothetical protein BDK51DRAFT_48288 [Blyttiomyces helicus]|uniref:Uncharacterized protein n=1 Tax=Blyttiomyces helicus TaxID=388810 RepID=A0A4P9W0I7_9FUNG|nr:hypothetical protein BDK51DRAFT_48288 [Blyttiomyces helicus]|eukprot:RKO85152.1 hypothetical protein BDK51DRAFT_48288 [Blyttiomyces helicus]